MELSLERLKTQRGVDEVAGLILMVLGVVTLLSFSYHSLDSTLFNYRPDAQPSRNWFGLVGANVAESLLQLLGVTAFLVPLALCVVGWVWLRSQSRKGLGLRVAAYLALGIALCSLLDLLYDPMLYGGDSFESGGYLGGRVAGALRALVNTPGAVLVSGTALAAVVVLTTRLSFLRTMELLARGLLLGWRRLRESFADWWELRRDAAGKRAAAMPQASVSRETLPAAAPGPPRRPAPIRLHPDTPTIGLGAPAASPSRPGPRKRTIAPAAPRQASLPIEPGQRGYSIPPIELLNEPEPQAIESEPELLERARQITDKFREFSVNGSVVAIHPGPVVTTFEFKPEAGVKYSKITGMTDDLSLALKAESVRIDRMPGRATVGIEVPNRRQETIFPRDLFDSERFRSSASKLTVVLGKDISGEVFVAELEKMPHLLIAGATGAGKSVGLNCMIASLLYKATPEEVRFIMIDTKMIELGIYADIPHLLVPVVTEAKLASTALKWAVREMERYRRLASVGVRNLLQFNAFLAENPERTMDNPKGGEPIPLERLPYIVIVIDELADLMMISSSDVEESIMRLAQMARAVGIHLIIATQRPSVDVITGTIKANFPSRIAFRVSQRVDSRTIIDQQGAEHLLGRGDMLFLSSGSSRLLRVHGGFITEAELNRITSFVKKSAAPVYNESILRDPDEEPGAIDGGGERDEMYEKAVRTVIQDGKCSITLIQRRLQLGYARAARIVDMMEREGVVSMGEGSKPREVLVGPEFFEGNELRP